MHPLTILFVALPIIWTVCGLIFLVNVLRIVKWLENLPLKDASRFRRFAEGGGPENLEDYGLEDYVGPHERKRRMEIVNEKLDTKLAQKSAARKEEGIETHTDNLTSEKNLTKDEP